MNEEYFHISKKAQEKYGRLSLAVAQKGAYCDGKPEQYVDYDEENIPTDEQAAQMCFGCPVRQQCEEFAKEAKVNWGVWHGEVYGR